MHKYKIVVYAISKNEEKYVDKWYESMKEADKIYVLDTGSTDKTVEMLKKHNVIVNAKIIDPWRFDIARNYSLKIIPDTYDIYVCTDLDEVFNKGWRKELENIWQKNTNRCTYIYNWLLDKNNKPLISFYYNKIHSKNDYTWIYPVHEILKTNNPVENYVSTNKIILNHYPDINKSRKSYLELLKLAVLENPNNDRYIYYLGREYMYNKDWNNSINTLKKYIDLNINNNEYERNSAMRFISRCYININKIYDAKKYLALSIKEMPYIKEPYIESALLYYILENYNKVISLCLKSLKIKTNEKNYTNEKFANDGTVYELLALSYFYKNNIKKAYKYINEAINIEPNDIQLLKYKEIISSYIIDHSK